MPTFKIEMRGRIPYWPDDWAIGRCIEIAGCTFIRENQDLNLCIKTEVEANSDIEARELGYKICLTASNIFAFCYNNPVSLDETWMGVEEEISGMKTGFASYSIAATIVKHDVTTAMLESAISDVQRSLNAKTSEELDSLERAIRWQALGKKELKSKIDRFIKLWVALEVLVSKETGNDVQKVKNALKALYPEIAKEIDQSEVVGRCIYALRKEIFHEGKLLPQELQDPKLNLSLQLRQLEDILNDLLRAELNLLSLNLSKKHFNN